MGPFKLRVIEPCPEAWDAMAGDDRGRFCSRCALKVHNLSVMTEAEALKLLGAPAERLCVRFIARGDGAVAVRRRATRLGIALRSVVLAVLAIAFWTGVCLLQRPWQAITRRASAAPAPGSPAKGSADESAALERKLSQLFKERRDEIKGAVSDEERKRLLREHQRRHHHRRK